MIKDAGLLSTGGTPAIRYLDTGPLTGPAVVLLHSLGTDHRLWEDQIGMLAATHRVLAPDSRGHGASAWAGPLSVPEWVSDLDRVLVHARVQTAVLIGVSMGGVQSLAYTARHPEKVRALVIADSFAELPQETARAKIAGLADRARADGMAALADFYVASTFTADPLPPGAQNVRLAIAGMDPQAYVASTETCFGARLDRHLSEIDIPALVLWGERDAKTPRELSEHIAAGIPGAAIDLVPGAGHLSNVDNPGEFTRLVREFLTALPEPATARPAWTRK